MALLLAAVACVDPGDNTPADTTTTATTSAASGDSSTGSTDATAPLDSTGGDSTGASGSTAVPDCSEPAPAKSVAIQLATPTGNLHGTWTTPEGCDPFPTVLFHVGSGPTDRDGNSVGAPGTNDGHLQLAEELQDRGIASVRYDKRGVAESADALGPVREVVVDTYVDDLRGFVDLMLEQPDAFGPITILGHSEGAVFATLVAGAAAPGEIDGLLLVAGPGRNLADVLRTQLEQNIGDPDLLVTALAVIDQLEMGNTVEMVPADLLSLFHPSVQPYLISLFAVDPAASLSQVEVSTGIIAGTDDIQVPPSEADVLQAAKPDATIHVIEGMTHTLKDVGQGQDAAYFDPAVPLADGLVDAVIEHVAMAR